jgi:E3 ubiquitin-protein ligase RGLG
VEATREDEVLQCPVCMAAQKNIALGCGHMLCEACALQVTECPHCRDPVAIRLKLYHLS